MQSTLDVCDRRGYITLVTAKDTTPRTRPARSIKVNDRIRIYGRSHTITEVTPWGHKTQFVIDTGACFTINNRDHILMAA